MGNLVPVVALIVACWAARTRAMREDGPAIGRLCLEVLGFLVTTFLFYVAVSGIALPRFSGWWRHVD